MSLIMKFLAGLIGAFMFLIGCQGGSGSSALVTIQNVAPQAHCRKNSSDPFQEAKAEQTFPAGSSFKTGEGGAMELHFADGTSVELQSETYFEYVGQATEVKQMQGKVVYRIKPQKKQFKIETPHGVTAVLGTTFLIAVATDSISILVDEGTIEFSSMAGEKQQISGGAVLSFSGKGSLGKAGPADPMLLQATFSKGFRTPAVNQR